MPYWGVVAGLVLRRVPGEAALFQLDDCEGVCGRGGAGEGEGEGGGEEGEGEAGGGGYGGGVGLGGFVCRDCVVMWV